MKYSIEKKDQYVLMTLMEENLNSVKAPDLKAEFTIIKNEGHRNLILDLSNVQYVDSSGLSAILTANRLFSEEGTYVVTGINSDTVKTLFSISRLEDVLNLIPTVSESIDFVMMEEIERELGGGEA